MKWGFEKDLETQGEGFISLKQEKGRLFLSDNSLAAYGFYKLYWSTFLLLEIMYLQIQTYIRIKTSNSYKFKYVLCTTSDQF